MYYMAQSAEEAASEDEGKSFSMCANASNCPSIETDHPWAAPAAEAAHHGLLAAAHGKLQKLPMGIHLCTGSLWLKSVLTHGQPLILPMVSMPTAHWWCCSRPFVTSFHVIQLWRSNACRPEWNGPNWSYGSGHVDGWRRIRMDQVATRTWSKQWNRTFWVWTIQSTVGIRFLGEFSPILFHSVWLCGRIGT